MRSMATRSVRYSRSKVRGQKHPREVVKNRNSIPNISQYITSKECQHPVWDNQCPRRAGHHRPSLPLTADIITCYVPYQGSKGMGEVRIQVPTSGPVPIRCIFLCFMSIGLAIPEIWPIECLIGNKQSWNIAKKNLKTNLKQNSSKI